MFLLLSWTNDEPRYTCIHVSSTILTAMEALSDNVNSSHQLPQNDESIVGCKYVSSTIVTSFVTSNIYLKHGHMNILNLVIE